MSFLCTPDFSTVGFRIFILTEMFAERNLPMFGGMEQPIKIIGLATYEHRERKEGDGFYER